MKTPEPRLSPHSIKNLYVNEFMHIVKGLETIPEQEAKLKYLADYLTLIDDANCEPILILFAYSIERLLRENKFKLYIPELKPMEETNDSFKINLIQLRFAADMSAEQEAYNFLEELDGDMYDFVRAYLNQHNIFGIRVPKLIELYENFKLHRFVKTKLDVSMFTYDKFIYVPKRKMKKVKKVDTLVYPALVYNNTESGVYFYHKYKQQVYTNVDIFYRDEFDLIFNSYDDLGMVFFIRDKSIMPLIVTVKEAAVKSLCEGKTSPNSYTTLVDAFSMCRRTILSGNFSLITGMGYPVSIDCSSPTKIAQSVSGNDFIIMFKNRLLEDNPTIKEWITVGADLENKVLRVDDGKGDIRVLSFETLEIDESIGVPKIGALVREVIISGYHFFGLLKNNK